MGKKEGIESAVHDLIGFGVILGKNCPLKELCKYKRKIITANPWRNALAAKSG
jgi:hypothetical protein